MEATIMLSKDELTRKMWDTYARECYKVIKKKENMPFAAMWMHPEILLLSEIREMEKAILLLCHFSTRVCCANILLFMPSAGGTVASRTPYVQLLAKHRQSRGFVCQCRRHKRPRFDPWV